jgi:two-component system cell cycle sensor histidine kinase/response regulator CckA
MADFPLQDKASTGAPRRRFDPWLVGAAVFFVAAAAFSAAPALKAGPTTLAGLLLLLGVAGVSILGLVAIKRLGRFGQ